MKLKQLTGTVVQNFTYDTPTTAQNDFYKLCEGQKPLVLVFLPNFGHPISRNYIKTYVQTHSALRKARLACVVRSKPDVIAARLAGAELPFTIICDAESVLYDYFEVQSTTSIFDWTFAAKRIMDEAKSEGYVLEKGSEQLLPLTMIFGGDGRVLYAHRAKSLTDLPEDCYAIDEVCVKLAEQL